MVVQNLPERRRIVLLNAFPLSAFAEMYRVTFDAVRIEDLKALSEWVREKVEGGAEVVSYVKHAATVEVLRRLGFPVSYPNVGVYRYVSGDVLIVAVLKSPVRDGGEVEVKESDLDVWVVNPLM